MKRHSLLLLLPALLAGTVRPAQAASEAGKSFVVIETGFDHDCEALVLRHLHNAHKEIRAAMFEYTKKSFADALGERARQGVDVRIKLDAHEAEFEYTRALIREMQAARIKIDLIKMPGETKMHHKFAVIDSQFVVTGSYNWTKRAGEANWENVVVIDSPSLAERFLSEWDRISGKR